MRLWPLITDLIARLIARLIAVNGKIAITPRRTAPARHVRPRLASPRLGHGPARRGERARARVWFTVLLLPASQVVYTKSTF